MKNSELHSKDACVYAPLYHSIMGYKHKMFDVEFHKMSNILVRNVTYMNSPPLSLLTIYTKELNCVFAIEMKAMRYLETSLIVQ